LPTGSDESPEELFYEVLNARSAGDGVTLWERLHPDDRGRLESLVRAERENAGLVDEIYQGERAPQKEAAQAGLLLGTRYEDGRALFLARVATPAGPLDLGARMGARVDDTRVLDDGRTLVRSRAGDQLAVSALEGKWHYHLPDGEAQWLSAALERADGNLHALRESKAKLEARKGGGGGPP
jgi:hypothetical protein